MDENRMQELVEDAKLRLRLHTDSFNDEIADLIGACVADLLHRDAIQEEQLGAETLDPLIKRAIMTYVRAFFGEPDDPDRLKKDYDEQKATLMTTTGYTTWSR